MRVIESACPKCNAKLDGATHVYGEGGPEPGDLSVCMYCSAALVFDGVPLKLRAT